MSPPAKYNAQLIHKKEITPGIIRITIKSAELAENAVPGQFVMIRINSTTDPLLRRPFSLCGSKDDTVEILYQVKGRGTEIMSGWEPGHTVDLIGPLGNGFTVLNNLTVAIIVAGGIGIAPLLFLNSKLRDERRPVPVKIFMGAKSADELMILDCFDLLGSDLFVATEDGSRGVKGFVTDLISSYIKKERSLFTDNACIFSCGPLLMTAALSDIADIYGVICQVSLESKMACGTGACLGCAVKTKDSSDSLLPFSYSRVCSEGPVFDSREILWSKF